ncbi:MAG: FG-GAP-like repeat-containing protein [bacterium]
MIARIGNKANIVLGDLSHNVYVWETGFDYNSTVNFWNGFRHDAQRTGCYSSRGVIENMGLRYLNYILDYTSDDTATPPSYGNGNAEINPGETIEMGMTLKNYTVSTMTNIYAILSSSDQNIASISVNSASFSDVGRFGVTASLSRFVYTVSTTASGSSLSFQLDIYSTSTNGQNHTTETILVPLAQLRQEIIMVPPPILDDSQASPSNGNADGQVEANETIQMSINLENTSWRTISGVYAELYMNNTFVSVLQNHSDFGTMLSGQITQSSTAYVFSVSNAPAYTQITCTLYIVADGYSAMQTFILTVQPTGMRQTVFHRYYYNNARNAWRVEDGDNGFLGPGESGQMNMRLFNTGTTLTEVFGQMYQAYGATVGISNSSQQYWSVVTVINNDTVLAVYTVSSSLSPYTISIGTTELYDHPIFEWELSGIDTAGVFHRWVDRMGLSIATTGLVCYAWDTIDDRVSGPNGTYGNGNGILDPGETIQLDVGLLNNSDYSATLDPNYPVTVSTPDTQYVSIIDPIGHYPGGRINANSISFNHNDSFKLYVANTCPDNYVITLNLSLRYEIDTAAVTWAWTYDTTLEMAVSNYPDWTINSTGTMSIITSASFKIYMGTLNYYELPNRRHSLQINDDATMNTSTTWANGDGVANPGETFDVKLRLWNRSTSEFIGSVTGWLSPADDYTRTHVTLLNSTCSFTGSEARGVATPIAPYFRMKIDPSVSKFTAVFNLYTTDSSSNPPRIRWNTNIVIPVSKSRPRYVPSFPIYIGAAIKSSPVLIDLNHNGVTDIIFGAQDSTVYAYEYNWANSVVNPLSGWPRYVNGAVFASPAVGDIFGTGEKYVVAATMYGSIYIWDSTGNLLNGWPIALNGNPAIEATPVLADVDHDGRLDVIVAARQTHSVYCFDVLTGLKWYNSAIGELNSTPAVANFMGDTSEYLQTAYASQDGILTVVDHTGQLLWQASAGGSFYSSPAVADLDHDNNLEMVIGCNDQKLYTYRYNQGLQYWESFPPIDVGGAIIGSPAIGDLQGTGKLSVVFGTNAAKVLAYAWDAPSNNLTQQWEDTLGDAVTNSPAIGDINGDILRETVIGAQDGLLYWYGSLGEQPDAWSDYNPLSLLGTRIESSPAIGDVMGDHSCCIVVGDNSGYLYAISMSLPPAYAAPYYSERMEWPMFHHEPEHTGLYTIPQPTSLDSHGTFSKSHDTTYWYIQPYGDADPSPGAGTINWLSSFGTQTGVLELQQDIGQKVKLTQVFSVPSSGWYTAHAKIATNVTTTANQQKVYLYLQELASDNSVAANGNVVIAYGKGGLGSANTWRDMKVSFYATNTVLGVQLVGINHQANGVTDARLYIDDILVYPGVTMPSTTVTLTNPDFDTDISGWLLETYADGTAPGTWSWLSYLAGFNGVLEGDLIAGQKGKMSQFINLPYAQHDAVGSVWVYSDALAIESTQKVYLYIYSYDDIDYTNIQESGNAILQSGKWIPGTWRQLQFGYPPFTNYNAVQLVGINPAGRPTESIYFDGVVIKQD